MNVQRINAFLRGIAANNHRDWFLAHQKEYKACRDDFATAVEQAIARIAAFDPSVAHLTAKDCIYRFNRDIRFSQDKSPYKRHFGAYISAKGKKSLHAGYYLHVEPGQCLLAAGAYWLPTNILTACRNEIMGNIDQWQAAVANGRFIRLFGYPNEGQWEDGGEVSEKGFGLVALKTCPAGFPRDYEHIEYLRMKDYCCWRQVGEDFFAAGAWLDKMAEIFEVAKPVMDFTNAVIDDYE